MTYLLKLFKNFCKHFKEDFDIIIDDASHNLADILLTLPLLFKKLNKGGFYVIEDINQFEVYKNLNPTNETLTPIKILKNIQQKKEFNSKFITTDDVKYLRDNIAEYFFEKGDMIVNGYNISDIVFIKKMVKEKQSYFFADYIILALFSFTLIFIIPTSEFLPKILLPITIQVFEF